MDSCKLEFTASNLEILLNCHLNKKALEREGSVAINGKLEVDENWNNVNTTYGVTFTYVDKQFCDKIPFYVEITKDSDSIAKLLEEILPEYTNITDVHPVLENGVFTKVRMEAVYQEKGQKMQLTPKW